MDPEERRFALVMSFAHGIDHFFKRGLPPLIPIWTAVFGFPLWMVGLLFGAHTVGSGLGQAPLGVVADRYDRRYILPTGIALMATSYLVFAAASAVDPAVGFVLSGYRFEGVFLVMLAAMLVSGFGDSAVHPAGYPLLSENVSGEYKGRALGMWGSASKFGDGTAPALIGVLLFALVWSEILFVLGLLGLGYAVYLFVVLGGFETRPPGRTPSAGDDTDGDDETGGGDSGADGESGSVWQADRRLYVYPMIALFVFFVVRRIVAVGMNVFTPEFITSVYGYSFTVFGVVVTPESTASFYYSALLIAAGIIQLGTGELVDRYDHRRVLLAFLGAVAVAFAILSFLSLSPVGLLAVLLVLGMGMWGLNPARDALISDIAPADREGRTFGYLWTGSLVLGSISPVLVGYIGDVAGIRTSFQVLAAVTVLSAVPIVLLLSDRFYRPSDGGSPARSD